MIAALRATRRKDPMELIAASGVIARETFDSVAAEADRVVFLQTPPYFGAVGRFFENFDPVDDEEVKAALAATGRAVAGTGRSSG
jgi:predicted phosphoribosyltransferase